MKSIQIKLVYLMPFLLVSCGVSKTSFEQLQSENNSLQSEVIELKKQLKVQNDRLNNLENANISLNEEKVTLTNELSSLEEDFSATQEMVKEFEFNLRDKQYQINQLWNELDDAFKDVETAVAESNQRITNIEQFLYLDLNESVNFEPGSDEINPEDIAQLSKLAEMLQKNPNITMMVEGHTDNSNVDKSSEEYEDNWDLSVARATEVIRRLEEMGVNPKQLIAAGRAEHMSKPNVDPSDFEANRRTEFIIVPNVGKLYKLNKQDQIKVIKP